MHRILEEIAAPLVIGGHALNISASIGVVLCPQQGSDQDTLLRHADRAMYRAKQAGKNRWYMFDPDDHEDAQQESEPLTAR
jgi:diguanylate cyclase (GGDEF)-like protein